MQNTLLAHGWVEQVGQGAGVWVSVAGQEVRVVEDWQAVKVYRCSTARAGVGCVKDSGQTPVGWHRVAAKIGDGLPVGAVLKEREWTGEVWGDVKGEVRNANGAERDDIIPPPRCAVLPLEEGESFGAERVGGVHPTGESFASGDLILSRILWLEGNGRG
jgi:hypothetical protein